jgi:polar amino acid transport system substrate-binding protein
MNRSSVFAGAALVLFTVPCAYSASLPQLYTAQQATDGQAVFKQNCAVCHGGNLEGSVGPTLQGQGFSAASDKNTVGSIFSFLSTQMPDGNGGSLSHTQYEQVMSYLLKRNGYPAGNTALAYDAASASTVPLISQVK